MTLELAIVLLLIYRMVIGRRTVCAVGGGRVVAAAARHAFLTHRVGHPDQDELLHRTAQPTPDLAQYREVATAVLHELGTVTDASQGDDRPSARD